MAFITNRRSLLLGAGAMASAAALGLAPHPLRAQTATPRSGGTFRLAVSDFSSADVNAGVKLGHRAAQNCATLGLGGTRVMCGGQSSALPI